MNPARLAREIFLFCRVSAQRARVAQRRQDLEARSVIPGVLRALTSSAENDLADTEAELRGDDPDEAT